MKGCPSMFRDIIITSAVIVSQYHANSQVSTDIETWGITGQYIDLWLEKI